MRYSALFLRNKPIISERSDLLQRRVIAGTPFVPGLILSERSDLLQRHVTPWMTYLTFISFTRSIDHSARTCWQNEGNRAEEISETSICDRHGALATSRLSRYAANSGGIRFVARYHAKI